MKYAIGLDCGIASVGYSVMELNHNDEPVRIINLGSRIFEAAEHPKDGSSLAAPRREARGLRRRIRRRRHRLERIRYLIVKESILTEEQLHNLFSGQLSDIYMLRTKALDEKLTNEEFARILINLAQRRGFKSNRKTEKSDAETGKLLTAVNNNKLLMEKMGYRTVGEMLYKDEKYSEFKRNKGDDYVNTVSRDMIQDEVEKIFEAQRKFDNRFADKNIEDAYSKILLSQRSFDMGPGEGNKNSPSPYAGKQIQNMIGKCTLIPEEYRAPKASYSFQLFSLWQNINNISLVLSNGEKIKLNNEQRKLIFKLCHKSNTVNYKKIRKELGIDECYSFANLSYGDKSIEDVENKTKFNYLAAYHEIRKALDKFKKGYIDNLSIDEIDSISYIFTVNKTDDTIKSALMKSQLDHNIFDYLLNLNGFSKFGHISVKACRKLIPFLENGLTYDKACAAAGFDFKGHGCCEKATYLTSSSSMFDDITNPVVKRCISQTVKVVNAIIRQQGTSPVYVNIELARELSKNSNERGIIEKQNKNNRKNNEIIIETIRKDFNIIPNGLDIVKYKLWKEQDGICSYTQKPIDLNRLFETGYAEVDHIIPYSISFDDSYNNKVLTFTKENRQKGNRIPMQYLQGENQNRFVVWVQNNYRNYKKKQNLLKAKISKDDFSGFKERNLNDTKYLSRFLYNFISDNLAFEAFSDNRKKHVTAVNGAVTAYMRKRWGIQKIRENGDLHHAVDAVVIACITDSIIQKVSRYSRLKETEYTDAFDYSAFDINYQTGEVIEKFPLPYRDFRKELDYRTRKDPQYWLKQDLLSNYTMQDVENVKPCFVSKMPKHKVTGAAHEATIRSGKKPGYKISKTELSKLSLDKKGEIKNYYNPESDVLLYNALKQRLIEFGGDGKKAFGQDCVFHKPKSDGTLGPIVKKVKIIEKTSLSVTVNEEFDHGASIADNGSMVRIDVFYVENDGYYFVPIYVADTVKNELPNLACVAGNKPWKKMVDEDFCFSLYPNDLIKITSKKELKLKLKNKNSTLPDEMYVNEVLLYYNSADISTASVKVETDNGAYSIKGLGVKTLVKIEKYTVDVLGNISKVHKEKRMGFNR